jgi:hypothetical protein
MKCKIQFKAKPKKVEYSDGTLASHYYQVPAKLTSSHCDMNAFRSSSKFGAYANSDLFQAILKRELRKLGIADRIDLLKALPGGVTVNSEGFLHVVTIEL